LNPQKTSPRDRAVFPARERPCRAVRAEQRGLAKALHSGDPAFDNLPGYFDQRLRPAFRILLKAAVAAGEVRADADADDLLSAVASLCMSPNAGAGRAERMVALLIDGLRHGARPSENTPP
jgi:hypothetical protein